MEMVFIHQKKQEVLIRIWKLEVGSMVFVFGFVLAALGVVRVYCGHGGAEGAVVLVAGFGEYEVEAGGAAGGFLPVVEGDVYVHYSERSSRLARWM